MNVWVLARPLSLALGFTKLLSEGKTPFCHLGLLVTTLEFDKVKQVLVNARESARSEEDLDFKLGDLWELHRNEADKDEASLISGFKSSLLYTEWEFCCGTWAGKTFLTKERIKFEGMAQTFNFINIITALKIAREHPDYMLVENNCQNFVKYLLKAICSGSYTPKSIQDLLANFFQPQGMAAYRLTLPGSYEVEKGFAEEVIDLNAAESEKSICSFLDRPGGQDVLKQSFAFLRIHQLLPLRLVCRTMSEMVLDHILREATVSAIFILRTKVLYSVREAFDNQALRQSTGTGRQPHDKPIVLDINPEDIVHEYRAYQFEPVQLICLFEGESIPYTWDLHQARRSARYYDSGLRKDLRTMKEPLSAIRIKAQSCDSGSHLADEIREFLCFDNFQIDGTDESNPVRLFYRVLDDNKYALHFCTIDPLALLQLLSHTAARRRSVKQRATVDDLPAPFDSLCLSR